MEHLKNLLQEVQETQTAKFKSTTNIEPRLDPDFVRKCFLQRLDFRCFKNSFGKNGFQITEENAGVIELICQYLNNEIAFEASDKYSLKKGLWIFGRQGSGKTEFILAYRDLKKKLFSENVGFETCKKMNEEYKRIDIHSYPRSPERINGIMKYCNPFQPSEKIFDDLGEEEIVIKDYGNSFSVMPHIIGERYKGSKEGVITHITTNLTKEQLTNDYGARIESRSFEMFNMIRLGKGKDSIDYRKI